MTPQIISLITGVLAAAMALQCNAQDYLMGTPQITACNGVFYDSGGPSSSYNDNEDLTTVVCPVATGQRVQLAFSSFNLSIDGTGDWLRIYDGPSLSAPLIDQYTFVELNGIMVTASDLNPSGCLTLRFVSNNMGTGDFVAAISCAAQCPLPIASFTTMGDTLFLCPGEELPVNAAASTATGAQGLAAWTWTSELPGMTTTGVAALDTLSFAQAGIYRVRLQVEDSAGCASMLTDPLVVVVRQQVSFTGTHVLSPIACLSDTVTLIGEVALESLIFPVVPTATFGNGLFLPDDVGAIVSSSISISSFPDGAVLQSASDIPNVCVSMEHSYMADLVMTIQCPNGSFSRLHQQGGGGTYIGGAYDLDSDSNPILGTCWDYCWDADSWLGTFAMCSIVGTTPNLTIAGAPPQDAILPGTYSSVTPLSNLLGCPLNGTWTLHIVDMWASDNGYLCSWSLGLGSESDSSFIDYSASIDLGDPASGSWSGPGVLPPASAMQSFAIPGNEGEFNYVLTVSDSEGCVHDTTLTVAVIDSPMAVDAGPDVSLCDGPATLNGSVFNSMEICWYTLTLFESAGNGWNGGAHVTVWLDGEATWYFVQSGGVLSDAIQIPVASGQQIVVAYTAGTVWNQQNRFSLLNGAGILLYESPQGPPSGIAYQGLTTCSDSPTNTLTNWSPSIGLGSPDAPVTQVSQPAAGWYVLAASLPGGTCMTIDSAFVESSTVTAMLMYDDVSNTLCMEPATFIAYEWFLTGNLYATTPGNCLENPQYGIWTAVGQNNDTCDAYAQAIAVCPSLSLVYSDGSLSVQVGLGTYVWTVNGQPLLNATGPVITPASIGTYTVTVTMSGGCVVSASIQLDSLIGIEENDDAQAGLRIVPNPNRGEFLLLMPADLNGSFRMTMVDATGRRVHDRSITALADQRIVQLDISLAPGAYSVNVSNGARAFWTRLIIE